MALDINVFRGPFSGQAAGGPNGGGIIASYTFATLPATYAVGQPVWVSDIGNAVIGASPAAATGSLWAFNGAIWRPVGGMVTLAKLIVPVTGLTNVEAISAQIQLPAGFLKVGDLLEPWVAVTKSGTTDTGTFILRVGTAGTTADTAVYSTVQLSAANLFHRGLFGFSITAATTASVQNPTTGVVFPVATNPSDVTIANISNALYVNFGATSSSTNNTVGLRRIDLRLYR